jgi:hypothetical protein
MMGRRNVGGRSMELPKEPVHHHTPEEEREIREAALDETVEATFPASDPPSSLPNPDDDDALKRQEREND